MTGNHSIDPTNGVEPVEIIEPDIKFLGKIIMDDKTQELKETRKNYNSLSIWIDGFKLINGRYGAVLWWKD